MNRIYFCKNECPVALSILFNFLPMSKEAVTDYRTNVDITECFFQQFVVLNLFLASFIRFMQVVY